MLRQIKPRNARSKRILEKKAPKAIENPKSALFLRGTSCSQVVQDAIADIFSMRQTLAKKFTKKNPIHPFEDPSSLEFFSEKCDTSLIVFGSSSKKRPHTLTLVRMFSHKVLDMLELHLDAESYRRTAQFKTSKFTIGLRPLMVFAGAQFESTVQNEYTAAKSLLLDLFRGDSSSDKIDVEGLRYVIVVTAEDNPATVGSGDGAKPALHLRVYMIKTKRSGEKLPRVELEEIGPRMDFRLGRLREADESMLKEAMKRPKTTEERTKKNISTDSMGDKMGRIHLGKQDLGDLQTRKMKGLKRDRKDANGEASPSQPAGDHNNKKPKIA
ncbi:ribosome biogenesis protein RPF2 [Pyricularia oryzae 70-15]|uniref:Ribosome production factor 2 homolog n=4 Tax=Pyricularia TaxID=48558 RepID=Q5EMU9_PYRGI|nr:ribosome biogenesis protein RPF2 [Pyricularia oryzae 70-15]AAX07704.1 Brix domain-containing protein-like protein [Pyricularia grisea]ELQ33300.1 ribosome biogenesis protein RPF2 [Pyricularia oryzae Y34]KAI7919378.1 ribosome biogenesis protein RPF2 [Pyricularia oryzae]EHA53602.1 ribosome biogenesis protein RPF2 [Pyricularia oryzae 70-15]KAI7926941.1 ribosome biogenesis protein RPF2 [Pyricularia oryzae]